MCVLDILLAVQQQPQQRTKELLDACTRDRVDDIALEFLGSEIGQTFGECLGESGAKHDDELKAQNISFGAPTFSHLGASATFRVTPVQPRE